MCGGENLLTAICMLNSPVVIVVIAYHHIYVDASNHYAPEPSVVFPTVLLLCSLVI